MSKKTINKSESKKPLRRNHLKKKIKKRDKKSPKQFVGLAKIKNKQNAKSSDKSKFKKKTNFNNIDRATLKEKNKQNVKNNTDIALKSKTKGSNNVVKKNSKAVKKLNANKINAMLNTNNSQVYFKKRDKINAALSLRERMLSHLKASRFRFLNEQMYNSYSSESKTYFQNDPQAFHAYHEGYKQQVSRWPMNPLNVIIESISKLPSNYVIADFGCGEAQLANSVPHTVHSFDLVAMNDKVKACDMAHTPLLTGHINVVVFCLSLMGSNLKDYLLEANRVLEMNGILKIAEVESRFDKIDSFIKLMSNYGFINTWKDLSNNLFYFMDFKKTSDVLRKDVNKLPEITLKSCLYKKR